MTAPHQRRLRELEATRRLIAELEALIDAHPGTVPARDFAAAFDQSMPALPADSKLVGTLERLAEGLRTRSARHVSEGVVRSIVTKLKQRSDRIGAGIEARDVKLRARGAS